MSGQILDYFAKIHETHIHARGKIASGKLIELLDCRPGEAILEMGFGSGATLAYLASAFKKTKFHGFEASEIMYRVARKRLNFCGLSKK
jgi:tRNA A58 N-methylase Trm61